MMNIKTVTKALVLGMSALLMSFAVTANNRAEKEVQLVVKPLESKKLLFGLAHLQGKKAQLEILDSDKKLVYKESWKNQEEGAHIFNFSKLAEGEYKMLVKVEDKVLQQSIIINRNGIVVKNESSVLPHVNVSDEKVVVSLISTAVEEFTFVLNFYNENGELVYTEQPSVDGVRFAKQYNFSKMDKGTYSYAIVAQGITSYKGKFEVK